MYTTVTTSTWGQERRFRPYPATSALPPITTGLRTWREVSGVPIADVAHDCDTAWLPRVAETNRNYPLAHFPCAANMNAGNVAVPRQRHSIRSSANRSPSPIEPVSDVPKRKLENGEQRLARQSHQSSPEIPEFAGRRLRRASLTREKYRQYLHGRKSNRRDRIGWLG